MRDGDCPPVPRDSPLHALLPLLPSRLEAARPDALALFAAAHADGRLRGRIRLCDWLPPARSAPTEPRGPHATDDGDIAFSLDFAERLWAVTFGLLVFTDHKGSEASIRLTGTPLAGAPPRSVVAAADRALTAVATGPLRPWPRGVPIPASAALRPRSNPAYLNWWVGRANGVFVDALTYLGLHEATHIVQHHAGALMDSQLIVADGALRRAAARAAGADDQPPSAEVVEARQAALEMEREADAGARELLLGPGVDYALLLPRGFAMVMACAATVFFARSFEALEQTTHPDRDVQLQQTLEALDPRRAAADEASEDPPDRRESLWRLAAVAMLVAAKRWGRPVPFAPDDEVGSWPRLADMLFDYLAAAKAAAES